MNPTEAETAQNEWETRPVDGLVRSRPVLEVRAVTESTGLALDVTPVRYGRWYRLSPSIEERFVAGCFGQLDPARLPLLLGHDHRSLPIGIATDIDDSSERLQVRFRLADTASALSAYELVRGGVQVQASVGFLVDPAGSQVTETREGSGQFRVTRYAVSLREISLVGAGALDDNSVTAVPLPPGTVTSTVPPTPTATPVPVAATRATPHLNQARAWLRENRTNRDIQALRKAESDRVLAEARRVLARDRDDGLGDGPEADWQRALRGWKPKGHRSW